MVAPALAVPLAMEDQLMAQIDVRVLEEGEVPPLEHLRGETLFNLGEPGIELFVVPNGTSEGKSAVYFHVTHTDRDDGRETHFLFATTANVLNMAGGALRGALQRLGEL